MRSRDPKNIMTALFSTWLPLSTAVLVSVIEYLPSPPTAQASRLPGMVEGSPGANFVDSKVKNAMTGFKTDKNEPVVAYVSKMVAIPESELTSSKKRSGTTMTADEAREIARRKREEIAKMQEAANGGGTQEKDDYARVTSSFEIVSLDDNAEQQPDNTRDNVDPEHLIGFARLYSGTLSVGDSVYVLGPKFSPANPHAKPEPHKVTITDLYLLMGKSLEPLQSVPAGVVFGIGGLAGRVLKNGTLCSQLDGSVNLAGVSLATPPIVRVSLEPVNPADLGKIGHRLAAPRAERSLRAVRGPSQRRACHTHSGRAASGAVSERSPRAVCALRDPDGSDDCAIPRDHRQCAGDGRGQEPRARPRRRAGDFSIQATHRAATCCSLTSACDRVLHQAGGNHQTTTV